MDFWCRTAEEESAVLQYCSLASVHNHVNGLNASCLANGLKCKQQTCTNQVEEEKLIKVDNGSTDNKDRESDMDNQRQNSLLL